MLQDNSYVEEVFLHDRRKEARGSEAAFQIRL